MPRPPSPTVAPAPAVDTTADQPALRHSQQLGLVRRPQVEIDVVGAETTHRIEPLWAGRAAQRLIPVEAACTPAHPALMEGVVHLLRGAGTVQAATRDAYAWADVLRRVVGRASPEIGEPRREPL